ncbi:MAG: leucine-rich repeat domain-containing protein [Anaerovoracaceae bacterium]
MALIEKLTAIGDAIREKTNTSEKITLDEMPHMISMISGEGGGDIKPYVNFYDWDGTLLHQYTLSEFSKLESLPELPDNLPGHTCVEWNYDIASILEMQTHVNVAAIYNQNDADTNTEEQSTDPLYVDGTKLYLHVTSPTTVTLYIRQSVTNGVSIYWGDGESSGAGVKYGTSNISVSHSYQPGDYTITFVLEDECKLTLGWQNSSYSVMSSSGLSSSASTKSALCLVRAEVDLRNTILSAYTFQYCLNLESVIIGDGTATVLPSYTFRQCRRLNNVVLSNSITAISSYAFTICNSLQSIIIPESVKSIDSYAFEYCYSLTDVEIPGSVKTVNSHAFRDCYSLKSVSCQNGTETIGPNAFYRCYALMSVSLPNTVKTINSGAFTDCRALKEVMLPSGISTIANDLFNGCSMLEHIKIPGSVTTIGQNAFNACISLRFVAFPKSVIKIGSTAFNGCSSLRNAVFSDNLQTIETQAFNGCISLEYIILPGSVSSIATQCFVSCMCVKNVVVPETLEGMTGILKTCYVENPKLANVYKTALDNCSAIRDRSFEGCLYIEKANIRGAIDTVGSYAFSSNPVLKQAVIAYGVNSIKDGAFVNCYVLGDVDFPESLVSILASAFSGCRGMRHLNIPENVTSFGSSAFASTGLESAKITAETVDLQSGFFSGSYNLSELDFTGVKKLTLRASAFNGTGLKEVGNLPKETTISGQQVFEYCRQLVSADISGTDITESSYLFRYCYSLKNVYLPNKLQMIGQQMFHQCYSLKEITIPENVTTIMVDAFNSCCVLKSVDFLGVELVSIGSNAFYQCFALEKISIPPHVSNMVSCFTGCYSLEHIYMYPLKVPEGNTTSIGSNLSTDYIIHVPKGSLEDYEAKWTAHAGHFEEFEFMVADKKTYTKYVLLSDTSARIKNAFTHSQFDEGQTFTITLDYGGTNLTNISNPVFDYENSVISFDFDRSESFSYDAVENLNVSIAVDGKDISCEFSATLKYADTDIVLEYSIEHVSGYRFSERSDGYYESTNQGVNGSYALCKLVFHTTSPFLYIDCISDGEANCDFGIVSNIDCILTSNTNSDTGTNVKKNFTGQPDRKEETLEYEITDNDEHFIYLKYRKDGSAHRGADSLKFKVRSIYDE